MHPLAADLRTDLEAVAREAAMVATAFGPWFGEAGTGQDEALRWLAVGGIASWIEKTCGGIERVLRRVAAEIDGHVPRRDEAGPATLLLRMGSPLAWRARRGPGARRPCRGSARSARSATASATASLPTSTRPAC